MEKIIIKISISNTRVNNLTTIHTKNILFYKLDFNTQKKRTFINQNRIFNNNVSSLRSVVIRRRQWSTNNNNNAYETTIKMGFSTNRTGFIRIICYRKNVYEYDI